MPKIDFNEPVCVRGYTGYIINVSMHMEFTREATCDITLRDLSPWGNEISLEGVRLDEIYPCFRPR